jgi:DNA-binding MarR family transcriptional regulator
LDRSADRILRTELDVSYRRFLVLFMVGECGNTTQRALAQRMELSEPSVSRMTGVLAQANLLEVSDDPAGGNRRQLSLTPSGERLVSQSRKRLARQFASLLRDSGVPKNEFTQYTHMLLSVLDAKSVR